MPNKIEERLKSIETLFDHLDTTRKGQLLLYFYVVFGLAVPMLGIVEILLDSLLAHSSLADRLMILAVSFVFFPIPFVHAHFFARRERSLSNHP